MSKRSKQTFTERCTNGQQASENMLNTSLVIRDANQNHKMPFHTHQDS